MIRTTLLAAGAAVAIATPALARTPAFAPIGYGAHGGASLCGFSLGRGATPLPVRARDPLAATALGRTFATAAAAQRALAVNVVRLRTCRPIHVAGITMGAEPAAFPALGDAQAAGHVTADGRPLGNVVFVRRGRGLAAITWLPGRDDDLAAIRLARSAVRHLAP